jgi:hypothetical protein
MWLQASKAATYAAMALAAAADDAPHAASVAKAYTGAAIANSLARRCLAAEVAASTGS